MIVERARAHSAEPRQLAHRHDAALVQRPRLKREWSDTRWIVAVARPRTKHALLSRPRHRALPSPTGSRRWRGPPGGRPCGGGVGGGDRRFPRRIIAGHRVVAPLRIGEQRTIAAQARAVAQRARTARRAEARKARRVVMAECGVLEDAGSVAEERSDDEDFIPAIEPWI